MSVAHTPAGRTGPQEQLSASSELIHLAQEIKALGLDRDQSIDLLLARLGPFCTAGQDTCVVGQPQSVADQADLPACLPEVGTATAARLLGVSKDTVLRLREAGLLPFRNAAPPGGGRPLFRFPLHVVLKLRNSYTTEEPVPQRQEEPPRRRVKRDKRYKHLQVEDED
jgi:hypothetical protein